MIFCATPPGPYRSYHATLRSLTSLEFTRTFITGPREWVARFGFHLESRESKARFLQGINKGTRARSSSTRCRCARVWRPLDVLRVNIPKCVVRAESGYSLPGSSSSEYQRGYDPLGSPRPDAVLWSYYGDRAWSRELSQVVVFITIEWLNIGIISLRSARFLFLSFFFFFTRTESTRNRMLRDKLEKIILRFRQNQLETS